jgi:DNA-binding XRE family transcriptional regulator
MTIVKLPHYLRTHRRRVGLYQKDVAYLLGLKNAKSVSRHENYVRVPNLYTACAYEIIFQAPLRDLFSGIYEQVEARTLAHAEQLIKYLSEQPTHSRHNRRLESINRLFVEQPLSPRAATATLNEYSI